MSLNVNPGFPMPTEAQAAAAAPGTLFVPLLDFSPAEGESWRSPRLLNAKVYVNAPEGASWHWGDGGFYQIEKAGPAKWLLRVSDEPAERIVRLPASLLGTYKTRQAALDAAATHLRERAEALR